MRNTRLWWFRVVWHEIVGYWCVIAEHAATPAKSGAVAGTAHDIIPYRRRLMCSRTWSQPADISSNEIGVLPPSARADRCSQRITTSSSPSSISGVVAEFSVSSCNRLFLLTKSHYADKLRYRHKRKIRLFQWLRSYASIINCRYSKWICRYICNSGYHSMCI